MGGRLGILAGRTKSTMKLMPNLSRQSSATYRKTRRSAWFHWMTMYWYSHMTQQLRGANNGRGEIKDADFTVSAIIDCIKTYWRNVHKQYNMRCNPVKHKKTK